MEALSPEWLFVPSQPTLWPHMLWAAPRPGRWPPFSSANVHWYYFARNAVWTAARLFRLQRREVLVPAYHHGVEIEALVDAGAKPRFYRVGSSWNVDVADVARKINDETGAIYLTHYAGFPGPTDELRKLADERGIPLIEDCALSLLSSDGMRPPPPVTRASSASTRRSRSRTVVRWCSTGIPRLRSLRRRAHRRPPPPRTPCRCC